MLKFFKLYLSFTDNKQNTAFIAFHKILFSFLGNIFLPSPSTTNFAFLEFSTKETSNSLYNDKLAPKTSNPGPKFAVVAGTFTLTVFIFFSH